MPEIINEWVGYNGKMTEEKKPDGTIKKLKHNKVWAAALTDTGHIYVRYGPAKHPLKLTEQIIRPKRDLSESEALTEAERIFHEKVQEKLYQKDSLLSSPFRTKFEAREKLKKGERRNVCKQAKGDRPSHVRTWYENPPCE